MCFRDERLDAFLRSMPPKKGKRSRIVEDNPDLAENDIDANVEEGDGSTERESFESPLSGKEKQKRLPKTESPPTVKKKRGRPRKIDISITQSEQETDEPVVKRTPGRPRKRKIIDYAESNQVC